MMKKAHKLYRHFSNDEVNECWNAFKATFQWQPCEELRVRTRYDYHATRRWSGKVSEAKKYWKKCNKDPTYEERYPRLPFAKLFWDKYVKYWQTKRARKRARRARRNRGKGSNGYLGGSINTNAHAYKIAEAKKITRDEVQFQDVWAKTRGKEKADGTVEFKIPRHGEAWEAYKAYCTKEYTEESSQWPKFDGKAWVKILEDLGDVIKKGRVPGVAGDPELLGIKVRKKAKYIIVGDVSYNSSMQEMRERYEEKLQNEREERRSEFRRLEGMISQLSQLQGVTPQAQFSAHPSQQTGPYNTQQNMPSTAQHTFLSTQACGFNHGGQGHTFQSGGQEHTLHQGSQGHTLHQGSQGHTFQPGGQGQTLRHGGQGHTFQPGGQEQTFQQSGQEHTFQQSSHGHTLQQGSHGRTFQPGGQEHTLQQGGQEQMFQQGSFMQSLCDLISDAP